MAPNYPDENSYWAAFEARCEAASVAAGAPLDWGRFRFAARCAHDIGAGLDPAISADKHVGELKKELGQPLTDDEQAYLAIAAPGPVAYGYPDENTFWASFEAQEQALYTKAGAALNWPAFRWAARVGFDIATNLPAEAAAAKHLYELTVALGLTPPHPVPVPRVPLPSFDPNATDPDTGAPLPVHTLLNCTPDDSFMRANLWGVTIEGAPAIPGGAGGAAQNRLLTYLLDRFDPSWQARWLQAYGARGYRDFWLSIPDSRDGTGLSLAQYLDLSKRVADALGTAPSHFLRSKDYDGRNPISALVYPWVDALVAAGLIKYGCHAWEASLFYSPDALRATIDSDAQRYPSVRWCVHLEQGYADFGPNGAGHGPNFWKANLAVGVDTLLYQYKTNPAWSAGMMQARTNDCLVRLQQGGLWGLPRTVKFVPFEVVAQLQFNNERDGDARLADEDHGDLKGYECLCSPGPSIFGGFGNGARRPDGTCL